MRGTAHISDPDGVLMLPAKSPYELEVLLDQIDWYAKLHGHVRLRLNRHEWRVSTKRDGAGKACASCHAAWPGLTFVRDARVRLCARCARQELCPDAAHWPWRSGRRKAKVRMRGGAGAMVSAAETRAAREGARSSRSAS